MKQVLPFTKMHGAGNDFIMIDARDLLGTGINLDQRAIAALCHRQKGVGADGLIIVASDPVLDFRMRYFNSDGGEVAMCGNGSRCAFAFAHELGLVSVAGVFHSEAGNLSGRLDGKDVTVELTPPRDVRLQIPVTVAHPFPAVHFADTGVPHLVIPVDDIEAVALTRWGPVLRYDPAFAPGGVNVNWVHELTDGTWSIRTYERGVEAETLACGTGAAASGLILMLLGAAASPVTFLTRGGDRLRIGIEDPDGSRHLELTGPAVKSFSGKIGL